MLLLPLFPVPSEFSIDSKSKYKLKTTFPIFRRFFTDSDLQMNRTRVQDVPKSFEPSKISFFIIIYLFCVCVINFNTHLFATTSKP